MHLHTSTQTPGQTPALHTLIPLGRDSTQVRDAGHITLPSPGKTPLCRGEDSSQSLFPLPVSPVPAAWLSKTELAHKATASLPLKSVAAAACLLGWLQVCDFTGELFVLGREFGYNSDTARAKAMKYGAAGSPSEDATHATGTAHTLSLGEPASKQLRGTKGAGE